MHELDVPEKAVKIGRDPDCSVTKEIADKMDLPECNTKVRFESRTKENRKSQKENKDTTVVKSKISTKNSKSLRDASVLQSGTKGNNKDNLPCEREAQLTSASLKISALPVRPDPLSPVNKSLDTPATIPSTLMCNMFSVDKDSVQSGDAEVTSTSRKEFISPILPLQQCSDSECLNTCAASSTCDKLKDNILQSSEVQNRSNQNVVNESSVRAKAAAEIEMKTRNQGGNAEEYAQCTAELVPTMKEGKLGAHFSRKEVDELKKAFEINSNPDCPIIKSLAVKMNVSEYRIEEWFQNYRSPECQKRHMDKRVPIAEITITRKDSESPADASVLPTGIKKHEDHLQCGYETEPTSTLLKEPASSMRSGSQSADINNSRCEPATTPSGPTSDMFNVGKDHYHGGNASEVTSLLSKEYKPHTVQRQGSSDRELQGASATATASPTCDTFKDDVALEYSQVQPEATAKTAMNTKRERCTAQSPVVMKQKKPRTFFTDDKLKELKRNFSTNPNPKGSTIKEIAAKIDVKESSVRYWFINRRHKERCKQNNEDNGIIRTVETKANAGKSKDNLATCVLPAENDKIHGQRIDSAECSPTLLKDPALSTISLQGCRASKMPCSSAPTIISLVPSCDVFKSDKNPAESGRTTEPTLPMIPHKLLSLAPSAQVCKTSTGDKDCSDTHEVFTGGEDHDHAEHTSGTSLGALKEQKSLKKEHEWSCDRISLHSPKRPQSSQTSDTFMKDQNDQQIGHAPQITSTLGNEVNSSMMQLQHSCEDKPQSDFKIVYSSQICNTVIDKDHQQCEDEHELALTLSKKTELVLQRHWDDKPMCIHEIAESSRTCVTFMDDKDHPQCVHEPEVLLTVLEEETELSREQLQQAYDGKSQSIIGLCHPLPLFET